ncbi:hypothetical protein PR048_018557 [Dryococelus australis]|uniref:Protein stoned-A n=1 Tax=Dryococelus australis TaxID=614101 RepID=A0ABQ9HCT5_9NEOP|nr:hypothetical protein PR048_018557 [Dryococelus australis]
MHKITKGLKKKKKSKKHKKEQELFDAEELERYRREHQESSSGQQGEGVSAEGEAEPDTDEWRQFKALTAGVDSILKKTQGDLDRIKSTSYFQQKPRPGAPPPATPEGHPAGAPRDDKKAKKWVGFEDSSGGIDDEPEDENDDADSPQHTPSAAELLGAEPETVEERQVEEEEEPGETDEDIFDTSYVDVVTSGEIKLAYIPESPIDDATDSFDPFDTSIAESIIKAEEQEKAKRKKLVSLGCAVDVLTGKADRTVTGPSSEAVKKRRAVSRRPQDINLLGSFDECNTEGDISEPALPAIKSLIDDDNFNDLFPNTTITSTPCVDLDKPSTPPTTKTSGEVISRSLVEEFAVTLVSGAEHPSSGKVDLSFVSPVKAVSTVAEEDDLEDEFAALAAESAAKSRRESFEPNNETTSIDDPFDAYVVSGVLEIDSKQTQNVVNGCWDAFDDISAEIKTEKCVPLKPKPLRPPITYSAREYSDEKEINVTDESGVTDFGENGLDPFDTSFAENILPGEIELKLIEKEILDSKDLEINEARILSESDSDFEFNPRDDKVCGLVQSTVSIHVTDPAGEEQGATEDPFDDPGLISLRPIHRDLLGGSTTDLSTLGHNPIEPTATEIINCTEEYVDPFDTSTVDIIAAPGKAELKFLEKEILGDAQESLKRSISDPDFNPRDDEQTIETHEIQPTDDALPDKPDLLNIHSSSVSQKVVAFDLPTPSSRPDLLSCGKEGENIGKPLTPYYADVNVEQLYKAAEETIEDKVDPFDTSYVEKIAPPGKAELKLIENEFVGDVGGVTHSLSDPDFNPRGEEGQAYSPNIQSSTTHLGRRFSDFVGDRKVTPPNSLPIRTTIVNPKLPPIPSTETPPTKPDLLAVEDSASVSTKLLTPAVDNKEFEVSGYLDPFDTSIASNLLPGKAELKVLESELVVEGSTEPSLRRSYTDPDFNPREPEHQDEFSESAEKPDLLNITSEGASSVKPLTPLLDKNGGFVSVNNSSQEFDPFDTSLVSNLAPVAKGANPFLMDDLSDYSNTSQLGGGGGMNSNPFLSGSDFNISGTSENPFLSSLGGVDVIESVSSLPFAATSTNPFATPSSDHNESSGNVEFFSAMHDPVVAESQNFVGSDVLSNIFDGMQVKPAVSSADMFFDVGPASTIQNTSNMHMDRVDLLDDTFTTTAEHPEGFCRETADFFTNAVVSDDASSRTSTPKSGPPKRPPPPRPPPSKETKDLILSVTGAMEATSSHLLDRLQATRTPSPTPIRDLHSPSPTPDVSFADFLGGEPTGISQGKLSEFPSSEDFSLMGDTEVAPSSGMPALSQPQIPPRPVRPPTQSLAQVPEAVTTDIMDIFSSETQPQAAPKKTNTDILGLFNTSASEVTKPESSAPPPTTTDLLGDVFEGDLENKPSQDVNVMAPPTTGFSNFSSEPHVATEVPETTVPKVSDSLPAALAEPIPTSGEDEFDAFTAKFENAAKDDVLASDPFDPFSGSAVTEESNLFGSPVGTGITDIWGSTGVQDESKTEGFEGEGDFDAFLTMKEPPTAALTDAAVTSIKRLASADSDEGPDFSVFIK